MNKLIVLATAFGLGMVATRVWDRHFPEKTVGAGLSELSPTGKPRTRLAIVRTPSENAENPPLNQETRRNPETLSPIEDVSITRPKPNSSRAPQSTPVVPRWTGMLALLEESEMNLREILENPTPHGEQTQNRTRADGVIETMEEMHNGDTIGRMLSPAGTILGENWEMSSGDQIQKAFDETGHIKGLSWSRNDGVKIQVAMNAKGSETGRSYIFPDGNQVVYKYDLDGKLLERWWLNRRGKPIRQI